jgi:D-alanine--D-alanine ligase
MKRMKRRLKIGFAFDHISEAELEMDRPRKTVEAEYEDDRTLQWLRDTLGRFGRVSDLPFDSAIADRITKAEPDLIFNITEGWGGRNRETLVPSIAETMGIPCTGSDAFALGLSLNKGFTKIIAAHFGIPTPPFVMADTPETIEKAASEADRIGYPLIVKPNTGGSSMGITQASKVHTREELVRLVEWILETFDDSALIERFIPGREYTGGILDAGTCIDLPVAETVVNHGDPESFYSSEMKSVHAKEIVCPAEVELSVYRTVQEYSHTIFQALGCKDLARVDFRVGEDGIPQLLEINPLPGLSPYYSIFPIQARNAGIEPEEIIRQLIQNNAWNGVGTSRFVSGDSVPIPAER